MPAPQLAEILRELRRVARAARRRLSRPPEALPLIIRALGDFRTVSIEPREGGMAFHLVAKDAHADDACSITCVIHDGAGTSALTRSEREVAEHLCHGRTLAQIARLRGVSVNTVKTQVRQVFRKLDVETRVALVRRLCP
ncbi:MAG TPA: helix-turn-helix transcriptional regulator [Steroidobacteraceae bacterium]|nr:helix-turn-helix transcriptional regulator [Steroidobacteraceae bacterium]